jgi:hypothetical protein
MATASCSKWVGTKFTSDKVKWYFYWILSPKEIPADAQQWTAKVEGKTRQQAKDAVNMAEEYAEVFLSFASFHQLLSIMDKK